MKSTIRNTQYTILIVLILICLTLPQTTQAATYYLDIDGVGEDGILGTVDDVISDDNNPGTAEQPWKTLNRAYTWYSGAGDKVAEGDTVLFKNGNYGTWSEDGATYPVQQVDRADWVTYKAASGHSPSFSSVYVRDALPGQNSYLRFEGFNILGSVSCKYTDYIAVVDCNVTAIPTNYEGLYAPYWRSGVRSIALTDCDQVTITGNEIWGSYRLIGGNGDNYTIQNNILHYFAEDGVSVYGNHLLIENNHIYDCVSRRTSADIYGTLTGTFTVGEAVVQNVSGAEGIFESWRGSYAWIFQTNAVTFIAGQTVTGQAGGATLTNAWKVAYTHTDGIQIQANNRDDIVIRNNIIHDIPYQGIKLECLDDGGGNTDVILENNLVYDVGTSFTLNGYSDVNIINNTFIAGSGGIIGRYEATTIDYMYNNIMQATSFYSNATFTSHGSNIFGSDPTGAGGSSYPFSVNSTELVNYNIDSLFVDAANHDYNLASNSVAIDFGNPDYAPATDILGNPRDAHPDAGCYEYGVSEVILGDVNSDGEVTAYDAALAAHIAVDLEHLDIKNRSAAEVSGDAEVSAYDAALIAQRAVGLIDKFPVE